MDTNLERRQFSRIHLMAHGRGKTCTIKVPGAERTADLIDISAGGARLKFAPPPPEAGMKNVVFAVNNLDDGGLLQDLPASIQWRNGLEVGVQFRPELEVSVRELQNLVS